MDSSHETRVSIANLTLKGFMAKMVKFDEEFFVK